MCGTETDAGCYCRHITYRRIGMGRVGDRCGGVDVAAVGELQRPVDRVVADTARGVRPPQPAIATRAHRRNICRRLTRRLAATRLVVYIHAPRASSSDIRALQSLKSSLKTSLLNLLMVNTTIVDFMQLQRTSSRVRIVRKFEESVETKFIPCCRVLLK